MRLVTVRTAAGPRPGAVVSVDGIDRVVDLAVAGIASVEEVLSQPAARAVAERQASSSPETAPALADLDLDAPVRPGKILCLGYNYRGHVPDGVDPTADPQDLLVEVERDGAVTVSQSTATTIFPVAFVVRHLSQVMTLDVGDVISTGTPQKLPDAKAAHRALRAGDAVTVRVSRLGELTTRFIGTQEASA